MGSSKLIHKYNQQKNKTQEKNMMRIILLAFIAIVGLTQSQRTPKPPPPPPGFESGSGSKGTGISFTGKNQNRNRVSSGSKTNRVSSARPEGFSPFTSKWVYCNGSWKLVDRETCPAVFHDSDFSDYRAFCSTSGPLYGVHSPSTSGFWHYNTNTNQYSYCADLPCCLCQACCERRW